MIRVHKNLDDVPQSLNQRKTEMKRNESILSTKYIKSNRYKQSDVKKKLQDISNGKCVFCEQYIEKCENGKMKECSSTVEHYRPKSKYYWLAYSWDNLLWCCNRCNKNKDDKFKTLNEPIIYNDDFKENIHSHTKQYNELEQPFMINPELESVINKLTFHNGKIDSDDERVQYTIETCELDREALNEKRKAIIDDFIKKINAKVAMREDYSDILKTLLIAIKAKEQEFIALRYWILQNRANILELN